MSIATWEFESPPLHICGNSSVGRAQPCQGWGREFESRFPLSSELLKKQFAFLFLNPILRAPCVRFLRITFCFVTPTAFAVFFSREHEHLRTLF